MTRHHHRCSKALAALLAALFVATLGWGCERQHPAGPDLQAFLEAVEYGDRARIWTLHVDSTTSSDWCGSEFLAILEKARETRADDECARIGALDADDLEKMSDELRLAVQVAAFACETPRGTCVDYGRRVFDQAVATNTLITKRPRSHEVQRLFGDADNAVAYVDLSFADGATEQRVFELRRVGKAWRVTSGFLQ